MFCSNRLSISKATNKGIVFFRMQRDLFFFYSCMSYMQYCIPQILNQSFFNISHTGWFQTKYSIPPSPVPNSCFHGNNNASSYIYVNITVITISTCNSRSSVLLSINDITHGAVISLSLYLNLPIPKLDHYYSSSLRLCK